MIDEYGIESKSDWDIGAKEDTTKNNKNNIFT